MILVFVINLVIGILVGISGIAGFLLPIFYLSVMGYSSNEALSLSFFAFIISGLLGSWKYHKKNLLDIKLALYLSIGSFLASFLGVMINQKMPEQMIRIILYLVVLLSGVSILFRKDQEKKKIEYKKYHVVMIGFFTGFICSLSGAGGPILVVPILILLGVHVNVSVAVALLNSVFIGIPSAFGYALKSNLTLIQTVIPFAFGGHAIGVLIGSHYGNRVNQKLLKHVIAIFSIIIALYKLIKG